MKNLYGKELEFPEDFYYSEGFLWVKDLEANKVRIGVSDLGVKAVKHLVHVQMSTSLGDKVAKGDSLGHVETTKGVWQIIAPLSGTVVAINPPIAKGNANPIEEETYGTGWLVEMEISGASELKALMKGSDAKTKKWLQEKVEEVVPLMEEDD
jgi:glycine cleavage system H protein